MGRLANLYINRMLSYLSQEGRKIVTKAQRTKTVGNRSFNQADAFGYVVYYNGEAKRTGYANTTPQSSEAHRGWEKHGIPEGTGREWLEDFIASFEPPQKGFALLIVNAAFYSRIQEEGAGKYREPFQILSQVVMDIKALQSKLEGSTLQGINISTE